MLSRLKGILGATDKPKQPSVVLILWQESKNKYNVLHIVPEDGSDERITYMNDVDIKFNRGTAKEQSREQLGTVYLKNKEGDFPRNVLDNISAQASQLLSKVKTTSGHDSDADVQAVEQALRDATSDVLQKRQGLTPPECPETYKVLLVHVNRSRPGHIEEPMAEPSSFPKRSF